VEQNTTYVAFDTSKETIAVALAEGGRRGEVRFFGTVANRPEAVRKLVDKLAGRHSRLAFCYEYVPAFRKMAQEAGRDPESLSLRLGGAPDDLDRLKRFRDIGVDAVNLTLMSDKRGEILPILDHWAGHIRQLRG
jgi:hypothetical protein